MRKILFVCSSNRSRSPLAAAYFQHCAAEAGLTDIEVDSAGLRVNIREHICQETIDALEKEGLKPLRRGVQLLTPKIIKTVDLIICMTTDQKREIESTFISASRKTKTLMSLVNSPHEVFDPHKLGLEKYCQCLEMMKPALRELADRLL